MYRYFPDEVPGLWSDCPVDELPGPVPEEPVPPASDLQSPSSPVTFLQPFTTNENPEAEAVVECCDSFSNAVP